MNRWHRIALAVGVCLGIASRIPAQGASPGLVSRDAALAGLTEAERAFARETVERGQRAGWLAWFASDGMIFRPGGGFLNAQAYMGADSTGGRAAPPGSFDWRPAHGDVSEDGSLGYSCGPVRLAGMPRADRFFFSVWRRQPDGKWKVVLDLGTNILLPANDGFDDPYRPASRVAAPRRRSSLSVAAVERDSVNTTGTVAWVDPSVRAIRSGRPLIAGAGMFRADAEAQGEPLRYQLVGSGTSAGGDMGYSYGTYGPRDGSTRGAFARAWRVDAEGRWRIVFEVLRELGGAG